MTLSHSFTTNRETLPGRINSHRHLSVFHSVSNRAHIISSAAPYAFNAFFVFVRARDCTTFTLHDLTDFCVWSLTAHRWIKINDHSCFHNRWPNSKTKLKWKHLWEPPGVLGALRSLCILCIGRIGSGWVLRLRPPSPLLNAFGTHSMRKTLWQVSFKKYAHCYLRLF